MTTPTASTSTAEADAAPAAPEPWLLVNEVFGVTVQGEGPSTGRRASFLRLGACNLSCIWCDSGETWDASRFDLRKTLTRRPVQELVDRLLQGSPGLAVITGGEPLLQQKRDGWITLLLKLDAAGVDIEVETNGTLAPSSFTADYVTRFNVSPKLAHAGDPEDKRIRPDALAALVATGKAAFKFVCRTEADVDQVAAHARTYGLPPDRVWVMPEGTNTTELDARLRVIADPAIRAGFNITGRLHVSAWGNEKGR